MSLQYEESVLDFDLDFFHQTSNNVLSPEKLKDKNEKCRIGINVVKKKIVATDSLIRKYYTKKDEIDQLEKTLYSSKEECKKVCIDFQNVTEKCNRLDTEVQVLRNINHQLQEKCILAESRVDALQSHAHQLQTLVRENETVIEAMKVENQLEKTNVKKLKGKDYEKKLSTHQKENDTLIEHIYLMKDVILGKRKLNKHLKDILQKYKKEPESDDNDSVLGGVASDDDNFFQSPETTEETYKEELKNLPIQAPGKDYAGKIESVVPKNDNDLDSDFSNEQASADTGRGSSLAFSDSDKCFHSPDYFMDNSPIDTNHIEKTSRNLVNVATSPIPTHEFVNTATSPMPVKQSVHIATSPMSLNTAKEINASPRPIFGTVSGISPLASKKCKRTSDKIASAFTDENVSNEDIANCPTIDPEYSQKECLELNNSKNFNDQDSRDGEIELILSKMRLTHSLITPIPTTPSKSQNSSSSCASATRDSDICMHNFVCKDALKVKEENVTLKANIMKLASEIDCIKEMLKSSHLPHQTNPRIEKMVETGYCEEDLIIIPEEINCGAAVISAELSNSESITKSIPWYENQSTEIDVLYESAELLSSDTLWDVDQSTETALLCKDAESLCSESITKIIPLNENQYKEITLLNDPDSRKGIKRLEFEEPLLNLHQNDLPSQTTQEKELEEDTREASNNSINSCIKKAYKHRNLTKLDRLKLKLIPKNKIKANLSPIRKNKKVSQRKTCSKAAAALNNKNAYEKAVKIMSELKSRQKEKKVNHKVFEKIDNHSFNQTNILDNILGFELNSKPSRVEISTQAENTSSKEMIKETSEGEQFPNKQNSNRIVILEDILLKKPQNNLIRDHTVQKSIQAESSECLDSITNNEILHNEKDTLTNSSQFKNTQEENKKLLPIHSDHSKILDCKETEKVLVEEIKIKPQITQNEATKQNIEENQTKIMNQSSSLTLFKSDEISVNKTETIEFDSPIVHSKESLPQKKIIATRSRTKKVFNQVKDTHVNPDKSMPKSSLRREIGLENNKDAKSNLQQRTRKRRKKASVEKPDVECKRMLRSSTTRFSSPNENNKMLCSETENLEHGLSIMASKTIITYGKCKIVSKAEEQNRPKENVVSYDDIDMFSESIQPPHHANDQKDNKIADGKTKIISKAEEQNRPKENVVNYGDIDMFSESTQPSHHANGEENIKIVDVKSKIVSKAEEYNRPKENVVSYDDIDMFNESTHLSRHANDEEVNKPSPIHPKDSILCVMIDKYGKQSIKDFSKKVPDNVTNAISKTIENEITAVIESSAKDSKQPMNKFVETIQKWNCRQFMAGLMTYLKNPQRKLELFNKVSSPSVPPMTKAEQILLYVVSQLNNIWASIDIVDCLLCNIEYVLFKLNRAPEFDTIESMSHFYAIICRYFKMKSRLRLFMLDAMYCIQFKAIPLIKQCMEVWMHVLPLAHMGIAKNPLVTTMVYLLHFYKCDDKFNRVQDIRQLLSRKYFYEITEWNDAKIIDMFRNAIKEVRAIPVEMKLLRIALIVIAKRYGPQWCQKHIMKSLLLPMIESDIYTERVKVFCVSILGALLKPYPLDMRVHSEIIMNMLLDMLDQNPSPKMEEAILTSLIYMSRHSYNRVIQTLLTWKPQQISPEFENIIRDFVSEKSLKTWKSILCKITVT